MMFWPRSGVDNALSCGRGTLTCGMEVVREIDRFSM